MALRVDLILSITKVVTTKRPCIPVAPLRDDRSTFTCTKIFIMVVAPNNRVVLLNIAKL